MSEPLLSPKQSELLGIFENLVRELGINLYLNEPLPAIKEPVSIDIEHDESGGYVGIGIYILSTNNHYWYTDSIYLDSTALSSLSLVAHNGISDFDILRHWGFKVNDEQLVYDTMLFAHILDSSLKAYGLKDRSRLDLNVVYPSYDDIVGKRTAKQITPRLTLDKQPPRLVQLYNALDCYVTAKLYYQQCRNATSDDYFGSKEAQYFNTVEKPLAPILSEMSTRGIRVDLQYLRGLKMELEAQQAPIKASILNELGPINLNSPKQLLGALNAKEIFPSLKGKPSTDKRALAGVSDSPIVKALLHYSELDTLLCSFVSPYLERGQEFIHPFFNQTGTRTGRLSCSNPNLLQIPRRTENGKKVRRMFIPRDGFTLGSCDYGQIEPRLLAHLSKDPAMCDMFNKGIDFHSYTAERLGIDRDKAKVLNLSVGYRATYKSVMQQLGGSDGEAQEQINKWWGLFPSLRRWQDRLIYDAKRSGFCTTLLGRKIRVEDLSHVNVWRREGAERQLINNITQASAREVMAMAMIHLAKDTRLSPTFGLLIQVYDELVFESSSINSDKLIVIEDMQKAVKLDVSLTVNCKIGTDWSGCH